MTKNSEETRIAVMQTEISYIKKTSDTIVDKLDKAILENSQRADRLQQEIDNRIAGVHTRLDTKADKVELERINGIISKLAWFVVLAVFGAIISQVII